MKTHKSRICLFLLLTILITLLTGCGTQPVETGGNPSIEPGDGANTAGDSTYFPSDNLDENGFWIGIRALDFVEMFNYQAMTFPSEVHQISDEAVQSEIDGILAGYSSQEQITDRAIADGDTVNIDYVGSVDGVEFQGGSSEGQGADVTAGSAEFIDDFLTQIIGHMPGDTFDVEVTFPEEYPQNEELAGKDAVFVTTINYIVETVEMELTDASVLENLSAGYGWTTVNEMKEAIRSNLRKSSMQQYIDQYFSTQVTVRSVPEQLTKSQEQAMVNYYQEAAASYSMELDEFLSTYEGVSGLEELIEANVENNLAMATFYLVAQAVAEDAGILVSEEDLATYLGTSDYSSYVEQYGLPYLKQFALIQKVFDYIIERAVLE